MSPQIGVVAGVLATALFVLSAMPMLIKAAHTKDLSSYSGSNLVIANIGNAAQTLYVVSLPPGPVWALHAFSTMASGLMLVWWIRHRDQPSSPAGEGPAQPSSAVRSRPATRSGSTRMSMPTIRPDRTDTAPIA